MPRHPLGQATRKSNANFAVKFPCLRNERFFQTCLHVNVFRHTFFRHLTPRPNLHLDGYEANAPAQSQMSLVAIAPLRLSEKHVAIESEQSSSPRRWFDNDKRTTHIHIAVGTAVIVTCVQPHLLRSHLRFDRHRPECDVFSSSSLQTDRTERLFCTHHPERSIPWLASRQCSRASWIQSRTRHCTLEF